MRNNTRTSGIGIIENMPWRTYFCQFYQTHKELMNVVILHFKARLENNKLCTWIVSQPLEVKEAKETLRMPFSDFDINLEVRDTTESKRAGDKIWRRVEELRAASNELARFNCAMVSRGE